MRTYVIRDIDGEIVNTVVADEAFIQAAYPGRWELVELAQEPEPPAPAPDPTEWLIDVGPFFDRFGPAKMAVLSSSDATVRALVTDLQVRKWIDLKRADVAQGIDLLISKSIPGLDAARKSAILNDPVQPVENLALRKAYFS